MCKLALRNSFNRASRCASTAIDAEICINYILTIALGNSAYRTDLYARTARNTIRADNKCHG